MLLGTGQPDSRFHEPAVIMAFRYHDMDCDTEAGRLLIAHGASPNTIDSDGWSALLAAVNSGDGEAVQALIDRGANVNAKVHGRSLLKIINWEEGILCEPPFRYSAASIQPLVKAGAKE